MVEGSGGPAAAAGSESGAAAAIEVKSLVYWYKTRPALKAVTFSVAERSIHGFVGPNGAGKTTALKVIATLLRPKQGSVRVFGHDIEREFKEVRKRIGFMPDYLGMYRQMTVHEYLDFFGAAYGLDVERRDRVIADVLRLMDMDGRQNDLIHGLSRGMQQRVALARLLVHDPDVLLLDEPASGLDPRARIEMMEVLKELRRLGKTIFISSHILAELASIIDSVTIIDRGRVKYTGPVRDLLSRVDDGVARCSLKLARLAPEIEQALGGVEGVAEVAAVPDESAYRIAFDRSRTSLNALLQAAMARGGEVVGCAEDLPRLDEAFMDLTEPGVGT